MLYGGSRHDGHEEHEVICFETILKISRTHNPLPASVDDVGVNHGRPHVLVAQKLLNGPDIVT